MAMSPNSEAAGSWDTTDSLRWPQITGAREFHQSDAILLMESFSHWWKRVDHGASLPMEECQAKQIYVNLMRINETMGKAGEFLDAATVGDDLHADCSDDAADDRTARAKFEP